MISFSSEIEVIGSRNFVSPVDIVYISSRYVLCELRSLPILCLEFSVFTGATVYSRVAANGMYQLQYWRSLMTLCTNGSSVS